MADPITLSLGLVQILLQLGAAYFAYEISRITGAFRAWRLIIAALLLMTARRLTALGIEAGLTVALGGALGFVDRIVLPLIISVCFLVAFLDLRGIFLRQLKKP